jgi:uncharacterized protein
MFLIPQDWYVIKKTQRMGRGVFAKHDIPPGSVIGDYLGKIMRKEDENELRDGLYTMIGNDRYDILGDPKIKGIHLINHSCSPNCGIYPYKGRMLYIATRKIFSGEEITVTYMLGRADIDEERKIPCPLHACHCGSKVCIGTMHDSEFDYEKWHKLRERSFGSYFKKLPGKYGTQLLSLKQYPTLINLDSIKFDFNIFGTEKKPSLKCNDKIIPPLHDLKTKIRETGRQLHFSRLPFILYGIRDNMLIGERI